MKLEYLTKFNRNLTNFISDSSCLQRTQVLNKNNKKENISNIFVALNTIANMKNTV